MLLDILEVNTNKTINDKYYVKGDLSGISGIEAAYEQELRGIKGMSIKLVDVHNRDQGKFKMENLILFLR